MLNPTLGAIVRNARVTEDSALPSVSAVARLAVRGESAGHVVGVLGGVVLG